MSARPPAARVPAAAGEPPAASLPLTQAQHGIWVGSQLYPETCAYNIAEYVELTGDVHPHLLAAHIAAAVAETDALHYVIDPNTATDGVAPQQVWRPQAVTVPVIDLTAYRDPQAVAWRRMRADSATTYPIMGPNLFYHCLFRVSEHTWWWYHRVHHVLLDGYGMTLLEQRVAARYSAALTGDASPPPPSVRLSDVVREEATDSASAREVSRQAWLDYLRDRPEPPTIGGRRAEIGTHVVRGHATLSADVIARLTAAGRAVQASWGDALIAAWAAYVHKMSGEDQVCAAVPYMARLGRAALTVPCMVLNAFPVWLTVTADTSLADLARAARADVSVLRPHVLYRYEQMRRDVGLVNADRGVFGPSVNIMPFTHSRFGGITPTVVNVAAGFVEDTALHVYYRGSGQDVAVALDANPEVVTAEQAQGHADRFAEFVARLAQHPTMPVGSVPVCLPRDTVQLAQVGAGPIREPGDATMWCLLEDVARRSPDAVAVVGEGVVAEASWTFAELVARCEQVAARLQVAGVRAGDVVAMALPPLADCVAVAFAAFRLGAALTAVDGDHPVGRVRRILAVAEPQVLVCCGDRLPDAVVAAQEEGVAVVDLAERAAPRPGGDASPAESARTLPDAPADASAVAVLTFTSGTTGAPKAVEVTHRNLVNLCLHNAEQYCDPATRSILGGRGDVTRLTAAVTASWSFDTVWEGPSVMLAGGCLHVVPEAARRTAPAVVEYVRAHRIDFMDVTPTFAVELLRHGLLAPDQHHPAVVSLGGEAVPEHLWRFAREHRQVEWLNAYGPSECSVDVAWARLHDHSKPVVDRLVSGAHVAVVSPGGLRAAPDARGELWVAGTPVTRGYRGDLEATAAAFVTADIDRAAGEAETADGGGAQRWYRTGDRAAMTIDGVCTLLGRRDGQMKVRGFRVETGEVETALLRHTAVAQCAALVRDVDGRATLVAYLVPVDGPAGQDVLVSVREALAQEVPYYMIPSFLVPVPALPRTVAGKLDAAALPCPAATMSTESAPVEEKPQCDGAPAEAAPVPAEFTAACAALSRALGRAVGPDDDFFAAGGHSLSAAAAVAELAEVWGAAVTLRDLFTYPTARTLTRAVAPEGHTCKSTSATGRLTPPQPRIPSGTDTAPRSSGIAAPWLADTSLPQDFPAPIPSVAAVGGVLVTGATGFVGAHVVADLIHTTDHPIVCLVRADDDTAATVRLHRALRDRRLPVEPDRVRAIAADAEAPRWGLTADQWMALVRQRLAVVHCAARVHHLHPYSALRAATVGGTAEMLRFVAETGTRMHYVSTINTAALSSTGVAGEALLSPSAVPTNGYVASKWAAESLCVHARRRGVAVTVHRPGRLTNATETGVGNPDDAFWQVMRGMVRVGCCPDPGAGVVDAHPVDAFAREVVTLLGRAAPADVYHHMAPVPVPMRTVQAAVREAGYAVPEVHPAQWQAALERAQRVTAADGDHSLSVVAEHVATAGQVAAVASSAPGLVHRLVADLAECGVRRVPLTDVHLKRSVEFWRDSGFFAVPTD